jgi:hypothetical protein
METPLEIDSVPDLRNMPEFIPMSPDILLKVVGYTSLDATQELARHVSIVGEGTLSSSTLRSYMRSVMLEHSY